ncbi:MAG: transport permease protein [Chitinophagales bacterium]|nr:MAG: transport permease protein [Chitinophagales bacterium]
MKTIQVLSARPDSFKTYLLKIWQNRALITTLAKRDLKIKYAQTFFGVLWVMLHPLPSVIIFTFFFDRLIQVDTGPLPYPIFALIGMTGWYFFTNLAFGAGNSLIESQQLLKKLAFPKLILPLSKVLSTGVDFIMSFFITILAMFLFSVYPGYTVVFLPLFILLNIFIGLTLGIWLCAVSFRYRDVHHFLPNVVNFLVWLTPVFYPTTILPEKLHYLMYINPIALVIEGYRFSLTGMALPSPWYALSMIPVLILFLVGITYFRKIEDKIVDYI